MTSKVFLNPKPFTVFQDPKEYGPDPGIFISRSFSPETGVFSSNSNTQSVFSRKKNLKINSSENLNLESAPAGTASFSPRFSLQSNFLPHADLPESYKYSKNKTLCI